MLLTSSLVDRAKLPDTLGLEVIELFLPRRFAELGVEGQAGEVVNIAVSMPPNLPALEGRSNIEAYFQDFFSDFKAFHETKIISLEVSGDWAIERGSYEFAATPNDDTEGFQESGKHIVIRKKVENQWLVEWEIWNSDKPAE